MRTQVRAIGAHRYRGVTMASVLTRRAFLEKSLQASASFAIAPAAFGRAQPASAITLKLANAAPVEVPANFTGLGYEMSSVATSGLLSSTNHRYIELIRGLGPQGVLRTGGIVANYTRYSAEGTAIAERQNTVITRETLGQFAALLEKINWTAIWSVNFAQGTIEQAIEEARAVAEILGSRLLALEIGNEVDTYGRGQPFRSPSYNYADYRKEYDAWHEAIAKAVPTIRFAAPDTASNVDWVEQMARSSSGEVQLLTTHYYRNGQKKGSADQLLLPDPRLDDIASRMRAASQQSGIPWRMCEINSFSGGGRPDVSDTFVGALWTLNTMLRLAQSGCAGVNMETGVNQLGFVSSYSPVQDDGRGVNSAGVPYYGMLAFAQVFTDCHQAFSIEPSSAPNTLAAYVLGSGGKPRSAVIVNTDRTNDARVSLSGMGIDHAEILRLQAPAAESKTDVTFGGAQVNASGQWKAKSKERLHGALVEVPHMSAAVIRAIGPSTGT